MRKGLAQSWRCPVGGRCSKEECQRGKSCQRRIEPLFKDPGHEERTRNCWVCGAVHEEPLTGPAIGCRWLKPGDLVEVPGETGWATYEGWGKACVHSVKLELVRCCDAGCSHCSDGKRVRVIDQSYLVSYPLGRITLSDLAEIEAACMVPAVKVEAPPSRGPARRKAR